MNKVREKLDRIDERLERIEQTYDILREIAKEFYESRKRQRQPNRYRSYEKGHRANQDGYFGDKVDAERDGCEICDESGVSDVSGDFSSNRNGCCGLLNKLRHGGNFQMKPIHKAILIFAISSLAYLVFLVLIIGLSINIPSSQFYRFRW